jgi:CubicO group peptidase (beta-lactamase class C family)
MKQSKLVAACTLLLALFGCTTMPNEIICNGYIAPGFEQVGTEFRKNFTQRGEIGAAFVVYWRGTKVVDIWGGYRDKRSRAPWREDTLVPVWSMTKGMSAACMAIARARGWLDYEKPVAYYWPEFAQAGKEKITVRQLLSHQAALFMVDPFQLSLLENPDALAAFLAAQKPQWEPGTKHAYHAYSLGWYESALLRKVDPKHRTMGRFFQEEVAKPLAAELYIGLPRDVPDDRLARVEFPGLFDMLFRVPDKSKPFYKGLLDPKSLPARVLLNPKVPDVGDRYFLSLENPAYMGVGQARAVARVYSALAMGGSELGLDADTMSKLEAPEVPPTGGLFDEVMQMDVSYSMGFLKPSDTIRFGSSDKAFGAPGASGDFGFADPDAQIGYAYATSLVGVSLGDEPREKAIRDAVYDSISRLRH